LIAKKYGDGKPRNGPTEIHGEQQEDVIQYLVYNGLASSTYGEKSKWTHGDIAKANQRKAMRIP